MGRLSLAVYQWLAGGDARPTRARPTMTAIGATRWVARDIIEV